MEKQANVIDNVRPERAVRLAVLFPAAAQSAFALCGYYALAIPTRFARANAAVLTHGAARVALLYHQSGRIGIKVVSGV